jgi:hypothetical protein
VCTVRCCSHVDAPVTGSWLSLGNWRVGYCAGVLKDKLEIKITGDVKQYTHESLVNTTIGKRAVCSINQNGYMKGNYAVHILVSFEVVAGVNETPRTCFLMSCCLTALCMTVGISASVSGDKVPCVRSTGPTPIMPSTSSKSAY